MRMRICSRRLAVSGPTRMGNTDMTAAVLVGSHSFKITYLTFCLIDIEVILTANQCHACAVVSTILQLLQSLDEDWIGIRLTNIE